MRLRRDGLRPAVVLAEQAENDKHLASRGITHLLRP
jgi:hypothetical protein